MNPIAKFKAWLALRQAKKEENKHLPSQTEIDDDQKEFLDEAKELKSMVTKAKVKKEKPENKQKSI